MSEETTVTADPSAETTPKSDDKMTVLFLYTEEPVHCGVGQGIGAIDQPIQREEHTGFPVIYGSSLRGALRDLVEPTDKKAVGWLFGNEPGATTMWQGGLSPHDARIVAFPVQSLASGFAWVTCRAALAVLHRNLTGCKCAPEWSIPPVVADGKCLVPWDHQAPACEAVLPNNTHVVLRDYTFAVDTGGSEAARVASLAQSIARMALPPDPKATADGDDSEAENDGPDAEGADAAADPYEFWRTKLGKCLVVLSDADFTFFVKTATQVITRVRLSKQKTVETGALWTEEALPPETILHAPVAARKCSRPKDPPEEGFDLRSAPEIMALASQKIRGRPYLGGTESIGRGRVLLRWLNGGE